jgi:hypothetical protein
VAIWVGAAGAGRVKGYSLGGGGEVVGCVAICIVGGGGVNDRLHNGVNDEWLDDAGSGCSSARLSHLFAELVMSG